MRDFVDKKLFRYLNGFKQKASGGNTLQYKIHSGYNLHTIPDWPGGTFLVAGVKAKDIMDE